MNAAVTKRHAVRALLVLHLIGLGMAVGTRFADLAIDRETSTFSLEFRSFGRDLTGLLAQHLVLPGFLLMVGTGIAMVVLRYGRRPPLWVWIKVALSSLALFVASRFVAPALAAARYWAHWSVEHDRLAPQFEHSAAQASLYGGIVLALFLMNIPVAVWKPFSSVMRPALPASKTARS